MKITTNKIRVLTNAAVLFIVQAATVSIISQVPMKAKDSKSSVNVSDFEKINLYDGKFRFNLPLNSIGGRGSGNGFNLNLESSWRRDSVIIGYSGASPNVVDTIDPDPYALNGIITQTGGYMVISTSVAAVTEVPYCSNETLYFAGEKAFNVNFAGFGVSSLSFISEQHEDNKIVFTGQGCLPSTHTPMSIGSSFIATDGSGTKFITGPIMITDDLLSVDGYGNTNNVYPSGFLKFTDGTTYVIEGGLVTQITDKNGNVTTITNSGYSLDIRESRPTSIKDSLSREILSSSDSNNYWVTYKGVNGVPRAIRVGLCSAADPCLRTGQSLQWLHTLFPWIGQYHYSDRLTGGGGVKDVEFPNGQKYKFFYNSYTELARVELPTGGAVEYEYESVANYSTDRRIVERRVYSDGVNLDHKIIYQYSHNITHTPGNVIPSETWTKVKLYDNQNEVVK